MLAWSRLYLNVTGLVSEMLPHCPYCKCTLQVRGLKKLIISAYTQDVLSTLMNLYFQTYLLHKTRIIYFTTAPVS